jgi:hypothetical protein
MNVNRIRQIIVINKDDSEGSKARYNRLFGYGISERLTYLPLTFSEGLAFLERDRQASHFNSIDTPEDLEKVLSWYQDPDKY